MTISTQTPMEIMEIANIVAIAGAVLVLTYASISTLLYIAFQDLTQGTKTGDRIEKFTAISGPVNRKGIGKVLLRLGISVALMAFVVSGGHLQIIALLYQTVMRVLDAVF